MTKRTAVFLAGCVLIAAAATAWITVQSPSSPLNTAPGTTDAKIICKDFVADRLKAPASASFQSTSSQSATRGSDGAFVVNGYVDAQNAFGANIRTTYTCSVRESGGSWQLVSLTTSP